MEIEDFRWYKSLVLFGCGDDPYDIDVDDPDVKLIPVVLEKTLITKLTGIVFNSEKKLAIKLSLKTIKYMYFEVKSSSYYPSHMSVDKDFFQPALNCWFHSAVSKKLVTSY